MKPYADLHMHSTYSDGVLTPREILTCAQESDIAHIAITDHDCLDGSAAGCELAEALGIEVIPGVEITTQLDGRDIHLLGYFVDLNTAVLDDLFAETHVAREMRALKMAELLHDAGFPVDADSLKDSGATVNRSLLARTLVSEGVATSINDAFARFLGQDSPYYVDVEYASTVEAIRLVKEAGGFPFIAHPAHYHVVDLIPALSKEGLFGLEAYHTLQTAEESLELVELASELGLAVSGGSDWHGDDAHGAYLGSAGLDAPDFDRFMTACGRQ